MQDRQAKPQPATYAVQQVINPISFVACGGQLQVPHVVTEKLYLFLICAQRFAKNSGNNFEWNLNKMRTCVRKQTSQAGRQHARIKTAGSNKKEESRQQERKQPSR